MVAQIFVILRKEWEEIKSTIFSFHNLQAGIWPVLLFCGAFSVYEPLRLGPDWFRSPLMVFSLSALISFMAIGFISPYSFVGERMRGTLEPLLATPVSDHAIIFGKIGIAVLYGWGLALFNMSLGLVVINLFPANGKLLLYPPCMAVLTVLLSLFISILVATIGTYSSYYAKTNLDAQRNLVMTLFIPMILPAYFLGPFIPEEWKVIIVQITTQFSATNLLLILIVLLFLVNGIFMVIALTRFHRNQLLLEIISSEQLNFS